MLYCLTRSALAHIKANERYTCMNRQGLSLLVRRAVPDAERQFRMSAATNNNLFNVTLNSTNSKIISRILYLGLQILYNNN